MRRLIRSRDEGFSLVWIATMLALLLGMAGFGTDLGWLYLNSVRTQNAVDAAALAGVVNLPGFSPVQDAEDAVIANGYDPSGLELAVVADNQLYAKLTTQVEPFFLRVMGFDSFTISRQSTAQYIKPVPLGSPTNCFGGNVSIGCSGSGSEDFWAAASGRHTLLEDGDPYSTLCDLNTPCDNNNSAYARGGEYPGYYYGVEVPTGTTSLTVETYNGAFEEHGGAGDDFFTGPNDFPVTTTYTLFRPDTTPLIPHDHLDGTGTPYCPPSPGTTGWSALCPTIIDPQPGIWLVHVETTTNTAGSNNFAIRATGTPASPRVFGINDMSIWSDRLVGASELYIAEVVEDHAGKTLELSFYDAGDANGESWYRVLEPDGSIATCTWKVYTAPYPAGTATEVPSLSHSTPRACEWQTQVDGAPGHQGTYNKLWIVAKIELPDDPADMCDGSDCWWKMDLDLAEPIERTTWRARVIGNPVRLVPVITP